MTDTSALVEGHHLVTAYPAAWCQCNHRLRWEHREQDHAAHVVAAIQAQALDDAAMMFRSKTMPRQRLKDEAVRLRNAPTH